MIHVIASAGGILSGVGALGWWVQHDGPVRLLAGIVAVTHRDPVRRDDAREVLRCTGRRANSTRQRRKPNPKND